MEYIEISAKTVEDAITKASIELGLSSDQLEYQVISQGSTGFLGIGSKPAVIQVRRKASEAAEEAEEQAEEEKDILKEKGPAEKAPRRGTEKGSGKKKEKKQSVKEEKKTAEEQEETFVSHAKPVVTERTEEEIVMMKASASGFLDGVFKAMELPVDITMEYDTEAGCLNINFDGEDMGILIGKRGQTLDSLQYLTSLVVNRDQKNYVRVKLDTEDYRKRRKDTLENLARNIASRVKRSGRPVSLEAMNPYERRIIHSALQGNRYVETHSEGNEPYRHVVVTPKRNRD